MLAAAHSINPQKTTAPLDTFPPRDAANINPNKKPAPLMRELMPKIKIRVNPRSQTIERKNVGEWKFRTGFALNAFEHRTRTVMESIGASLDRVNSRVQAQVRLIAPDKLQIGKTLVITTQGPIAPAFVVIPAHANENQW